MTLPVRHKENPFLIDMMVPTRSKNIRLSRLGADDNTLVNHITGESAGTHVTTYKKVDSAQFVKLFTANIALTFDLKAAGIKAMNVLIWTVQHNAISKDQVDLERLTLEFFLESHTNLNPPLKLSVATFQRGISELEKANIIAKTMKKGRYFINPNFVFNGDRIAFTTVIERTSDDSHLQQNLL